MWLLEPELKSFEILLPTHELCKFGIFTYTLCAWVFSNGIHEWPDRYRITLSSFQSYCECKIWVNYCLEFCQHDVLGPMEIRCKNDLNSVWRVFVRQCQFVQLVERTFFLRGGLSMLETYKDIEKRFARWKSSKNIYTFIRILKFYYSYGENLYNNNFIST